MGDLNAKVGESCTGNVVGDFGLGERNKRGESWDQVIMNTFFGHHPRRLYTWRNPGDRVRNQIDYITINKRFRNCLRQVKTYPGADCVGGCDRVLVVTEMSEVQKNEDKQESEERLEYTKKRGRSRCTVCCSSV